MNRWSIVSLLVLFAVFPLQGFAKAERYALLVGVGNYPKSPLEGPKYDVAAIRKVLTENWSFPAGNITVLLDEQGTKDNIISAIKSLYDKSRSGDELFLYFSGHGTSASDQDLRFPLPTTSGAYIPYDIREAKTIKQAVKKLVIGKQDLKPVLTRLDKGGRHVFIAIDACYSGNTVRGQLQDATTQLPSRFLDIATLLPAKAFGDDLEKTGDAAWKEPSNQVEQYPYENIYYLSASGEHEQAKDIPSNRLGHVPTLDNKPHGAFTDTLLRVLNNSSTADINADGIITYKELTHTVRKLMRLRGFAHTPNGLPSAAEDDAHLATRGIFLNLENDKLTKHQKLAMQAKEIAKKIAQTKTSQENNFNYVLPSIDTSVFRVNALNISDALVERLKKLKGVKLVSAPADLVLKKVTNGFTLISGAGDLILTIDKPADNEIVNLVKHQAWVHHLVNGHSNQDFNVSLDFFGTGRGSIAVKGEDIGFTVISEEKAYLLLVDIDAYGKISVIYPFFKKELASVNPGQVVNMENIAKVGPPYGRDYIQIYAFDTLTPELEKLVGATIEPDSALKSTFERLINNPGVKKARASIELVTADRR